MKLCWLRLGLMGAAGTLAAGLLAGCEVDSASARIEITPDSAVMGHVGQEVALTCVGGYECTWSLGTETYGTLSTRRGNQVVYTSRYQPAGDSTVLQVVTVASHINPYSALEGAMLAGATNLPSTNVQYATAHITHLGTGSTNSL